ncbi:molybdenum cofactor guanylyltransferase [Pseudocolwellia agarivorans]|uniref:molybdenum cofactor guanylyltransferase n=1 Tax=Pseudocolwellia agarivorans TaxID=1911682 RepID=UPI0009871C2E|nr:molybdenum cofactor guanylyltransferase [Pseudocolwellia agarivorans]
MIIVPNTKNNQSKPNNQCLGVVLAGGLSSRMGVDKASLLRNEVSMLTYSKQLLTEIGLSNIVISGKPSCATPQDVIVADKYAEMGPMGGIASVIEKHQPSALFVLPVDLPLITADALQKLKQIGELSQQACFYNDNYLPLYLPVNAHTENFLKSAFSQQANSLDKSKTSTAKSGPSIRALLKQVPHKAIAIETPSSLLNTNTTEEWATAQKSFTQLSLSQQKNTHVKYSKNNLLNSRK